MSEIKIVICLDIKHGKIIFYSQTPLVKADDHVDAWLLTFLRRRNQCLRDYNESAVAANLSV